MIALFLAACTYVAPISVESCDAIGVRAQCDAGPLCLDVPDQTTAAIAYAWQCGGTGDASAPGESDDCVSIIDRVYSLGDATGDRVCVTCEDIDGDTGPSDAQPWTYAILGVCEPINDTAGG